MSKDVNVIMTIGRLGRDAELKYLPNGTALCNFPLASTGYKDKTLWFDVKFFGKGAESVNQYLTKGKQVAVSGTLEQDEWEKDGQKKTKLVINVTNIQFLGDRVQETNKAPQQKQEPKTSTQIVQDVFVDDIPF